MSSSDTNQDSLLSVAHLN